MTGRGAHPGGETPGLSREGGAGGIWVSSGEAAQWGAGTWKVSKPRKPVPSSKMGRESALRPALGGATGPQELEFRAGQGQKLGWQGAQGCLVDREQGRTAPGVELRGNASSRDRGAYKRLLWGSTGGKEPLQPQPLPCPWPHAPQVHQDMCPRGELARWGRCIHPLD